MPDISVDVVYCVIWAAGIAGVLYMIIQEKRKKFNSQTKKSICMLIGIVTDACHCTDKSHDTIYNYLSNCFVDEQTEDSMSQMMNYIDTVVKSGNKDKLQFMAIATLKKMMNKKERARLVDFLCTINDEGDLNPDGWNLISNIANLLEVNLLNANH